MASFPGAVKTFTTKNPDDTIQPSHIDDLQDEVNAIEDGYLNGSARLNSSNSTLRALSVTAGSTFAGATQFNGPLTVNSSVTLNAGGSVGTAGQVLQSNGSSGIRWADQNNVVTYTPASFSTVVNSGSSLALFSFEISSGAWLVGQRLQAMLACAIQVGTANPTLTFSWRVGGNKVSGVSGTLGLTTGSTNLLLPFWLQRVSTSIWLFTGNSSNTNDGWSMPYGSLTSQPNVSVISGVDFASTNTVAFVAKWSTGNSSNSFGVVGANLVKV
jgi:hypothetical protein